VVGPVKRTTCSACGHTDLEQFLDLGMSPIADAYTSTPDEISPTYPLQVAVCAKCRLVQLLEVLDGQTLFGTGYSFYSSASPPLSAYHRDYALGVLGRHRDLARRGVVEVGCNDGDLLRHFAAFPHLGVDPAVGPTDAARERGLDVTTTPFGLHAAHEIRDRRGRQGLVFANHVLAHVEDVADVLAGIAALLADDGLAYIEVQYLPDLLVNNAFDLVYHEHRNFFSLTSLEQAAVRHGLYVAGAELTDRQGGSLRATLSRSAARQADVGRILASEMWLNSFGAYEGMQGRAERIRDRLLDVLAAQQGITAVYGAPAKATTLLNFCGLTSDDLPWAVDTTPAKQGRHIPGTGIPIVPPDFMGAGQYLMTAWNYFSAIARKNPHKRWIIPFPAPVIL
jgi:SAM-dependent methyltransferase